MPDERVDVEPAAILLGQVAEIQGIAPDTWTEGTVSEVALRLDRVEYLIAKLNEISGWLETVLTESMEEDAFELPGIGLFHRQEKKRSTWRYKHSGEQLRNDLAAAVAADVSMDVATGELDPLKRNIALATMRAAYEAIPSFSSINVPGRKRFGLDLEDYRTTETYYGIKIERNE